MKKEKKEKMPTPGHKLSQEKVEEIIEKFDIEYRDGEKESGADIEYFIIRTKDRGSGSEEKRKEVSHYLPKWEKIPDEELGWISVEEIIEAIQKHYSNIGDEEKFPTRAAVKKLRADKKNE